MEKLKKNTNGVLMFYGGDVRCIDLLVELGVDFLGPLPE